MKTSKLVKLGAWTWVGLQLVGCSPGHDARLAAAQQYLDRREPASAVLEAKSALQDRPESSAARVLLGRALLATGDLQGALVELERVWQRDPSAANVAPHLAAAWLASGQPQKVIETFDPVTLAAGGAGGALAYELARAHLMSGDRDRASERLEQGLALAPAQVSLQVLKARLRAVSGDQAGAWSEAERLAGAHPSEADAWVLKGDLARAHRKDIDVAVDSYRRALALQPDSSDAHTALIDIAVEAHDLARARQQVSVYLKARPGNAQALLMDATVALLEGRLDRARELAQTLLRVSPRHPKVLFLSGLTEARLGSWALAETQLTQAVAGDPGAEQPRIELGRVLLMQGKAQRALDSVGPLAGRQASSPAALLIAAQAHLLLGDVVHADAAFARASGLEPNNPELRTARALTMLQRGAGEAALAELAAVAKADAQATADLALVTGLMKAGKYKQAMAAAEAFAVKVPSHPMPDQLRGQIAVAMKAPHEAEQFFGWALKKDVKYLPAMLGLVQLDLASGKPDRARGRFVEFLRTNPRHVAGMLAYANHLLQQGAREEASQTLSAALQIDPTDPAVRIAVIDQHLRIGDLRSALQAAQSAAAALPENVAVLELVAAAQMAAGEANQAVSTMSQVLTKRADVSSHLSMARALQAAGRLDAAQTQINDARRLDANDPSAIQAAAWLAIQRGRFAEALELAKLIQRLRPGEAIGHRLEAEVALIQGQTATAVAALRAATAKRQPGDAPGVLYKALLASGKADEATQFAKAWVQGQPADLPFRLHLADQALARGDTSTAEQGYRGVLELQPDNVWALTNLAGMLLEARPADALALADKAAQAAPFRADVKTVKASALAANRRLDDAVSLQLEAVSLAPEAPGLRLALARLYLAAGKKEKARDQLEPLLSRPASPALLAEVRTMLQQSNR